MAANLPTPSDIPAIAALDEALKVTDALVS